VVSQEILKTTDVFVIHHTDCGGQAAVKQHGMLIQAMVDKLPFLFGLVLRLLDTLSMTGLLLKPIRNLERSIYEDVEKLKSNPMVPKSIGIYGFLYSTEDGSLKEITRRLPVRGKKLQWCCPGLPFWSMTTCLEDISHDLRTHWLARSATLLCRSSWSLSLQNISKLGTALKTKFTWHRSLLLTFKLDMAFCSILVVADSGGCLPCN